MTADQRTTSLPPASAASDAIPSAAMQGSKSIKDEEKSNSTKCIPVSNDPYMSNICN